MRILLLGDIVGKRGREVIRDFLPSLRDKYQPDFIIVNGENAAHGKGLTIKIYNEFMSYGIDCITMDNHTFSKKEINDIGVIRLSLDILAIKLAIIYSTKNDFLRLKEIAENCYLAYENNDGLKRRKLDTRFHEYLCELSKNELLLSMQHDLSLKIQFLLLHNNLPDVEDVEHIKQHIEIANALINGNEKKAIEIDIDHLYEFYNLDVPLDFFK